MGQGTAQTTETSSPGDGGRREFRRRGNKDSVITGRDEMTDFFHLKLPSTLLSYLNESNIYL